MQQTPPLASISHSTPAARTPQTQRQHHTKGEEEERVSELEREGVSSPPIISFLSFGKKRKKRKFPAFFPPPLLFYAINLIPCKQQKRKEKKKEKCTKRFLSSLLPDAIQDTFGEEMTGKERRGRAASTSRGRNDAIFF